MTTTRTTYAFVTVMALLIYGCDPAPEKASSKSGKTDESALTPEMRAILQPLADDPKKAFVELTKKFDAAVNISDGLIIVRDPALAGMQTEIYPTTVPWKVSCGIGVTVAFGINPPVASDNSATYSDLTLTLSSVPKGTAQLWGQGWPDT